MPFAPDIPQTRVSRLPRLIALITALVLLAGLVAALLWLHTGDIRFIHLFFAYPGSLFLIACSTIQLRVSFECWRNFSSGDLLRPAWLLITISALVQLAGGMLNQIFTARSYLNPLLWLHDPARGAMVQMTREYGPLLNPLYMLLLALGLFYVLKACRQSGILGRFRAIDILLLSVVAAYTVGFFATVVFAPHHNAPLRSTHRILSWTSDPLLCILLLEAILIRRSAANMGWGLIARCWFYFTAAVFATSVGDIGLWAWSQGYLPEALQIASWYVWFPAAAAYALGPCYQLQAILHATAAAGKAQLSDRQVTLPA